MWFSVLNLRLLCCRAAIDTDKSSAWEVHTFVIFTIIVRVMLWVEYKHSEHIFILRRNFRALRLFCNNDVMRAFSMLKILSSRKAQESQEVVLMRRAWKVFERISIPTNKQANSDFCEESLKMIMLEKLSTSTETSSEQQQIFIYAEWQCQWQGSATAAARGGCYFEFAI